MGRRVLMLVACVGIAAPALPLTSRSSLTLDGGSFSVLDGATFAGQGLLELMKPGEKRLLSYAADLGALVESRNGDELRRVSRVRVERGDLIQQVEQRSRKVYTMRNSDTTARTIVIEHPIRVGWTLIGDARPAETSTSTYRFVVEVEPKSTASLVIDERHPVETRVAVSQFTDDQLTVLLRDTHADPNLSRAMEPVRAAKAAVAGLADQVGACDAETATIAGDQQRLRENMRALKGSAEEQQLLKRYVSQLNAQEDRVASIRVRRADLASRLVEAEARLSQAIEHLAFDMDFPSARR